MSAPQFTPGPWMAFKDRHNESYVIDTALGRASTNVTVIADEIRGEQRHANAALIAAAPELYGTVAFAFQHLNDDTFHGDAIDTFFSMAKLALAKSRGDTESRASGEQR